MDVPFHAPPEQMKGTDAVLFIFNNKTQAFNVSSKTP